MLQDSLDGVDIVESEDGSNILCESDTHVIMGRSDAPETAESFCKEVGVGWVLPVVGVVPQAFFVLSTVLQAFITLLNSDLRARRCAT